MSAIWGMISSEHKERFPQISSAMKEKMGRYKIDRIDEIQRENVFFACGHQYLTPEAQYEVLPFYDEEHDTYFTADCIIDNREELLTQLSVHVNPDECITDSYLAWLSWLKWGENFVLHLRGIFSFAIYVCPKDLFLLYTDHTSVRCINYSVRKDIVCFSTTYDLFKTIYGKDELAVSEKWIVGCEAQTSACMILFPGTTPYENVFQVLAGHYLRVERGKATVCNYWNPLKTPELHLPDREAYGQLFRNTFQQCVGDLLRPGVKIAAQLSSGLDSTSVVCVAAPVLAERGQVLNTYTSVPAHSANLKNDGFFRVDESAPVRRTAEFFHNIDCHFISLEGESPLTNLEERVRAFGLPVKSAINLSWIEKAEQEACQIGCTYMLIGQHGNMTISMGDAYSLIYQQLLQLHPITAYRTARNYTRRNRIYFRKFVKSFVELWYYNNIYPGSLFTSALFRDTYVRKTLIQRHHIVAETRRRNRREGYGLEYTRKQKVRMPWELDEMQQVGIYTTMQSLKNGIVDRDPTKDPRMIELCISFPMEQFVADGMDRYLVRGQLKGIVPDHIRQDFWHRGKQGADFVYRINQNWSTEKEKVLRCLKVPALTEYMEPTKLEEMIIRCESVQDFSDEDEQFLLNVIFFTSLGSFLAQE